MRLADLAELRVIQTEILDVVDRFCEENHIRYWLDGGTLIGAIRHKGYIPWDDDIDIGMLRTDFDRFIREFNTYDERYEVNCFEIDPLFAYAYAKVMDKKTILYEPDENGKKLHINIDVFAYDNAPDDSKLEEKMFRRRDFFRDAHIQRTASYKPTGSLPKRALIRFARVLSRPFPRDFFVKKLIENAKTYSDVETTRFGNFVGVTKFACSKRVLNSLVDAEFEGRLYKVPEGYDEYLTQCFGDYMKLPPQEEQVSHHMFKAYVEEAGN